MLKSIFTFQIKLFGRLLELSKQLPTKALMSHILIFKILFSIVEKRIRQKIHLEVPESKSFDKVQLRELLKNVKKRLKLITRT